MKRVLLLAVTCLACGKAPSPVADAAAERPTADAPRVADASPTLTVDFAVEGCPSFDAQSLSCVGTPPLILRFVPVVTAEVSQYMWDFGDSSSFDTRFDARPTPVHIYNVPGQYSVKLLVNGLDGEAVSKSHDAFVKVTANDVGGACDMDDQCADKLTCFCPSSSSCTYGPPHGICAGLCQFGTCPGGKLCAGLATATPPSGMRESWQASLCLQGCSSDQDCDSRLRCRLLPPSSPSTTWVHVCFGDFPVDVGQPCADETNALRDDLCSTGICANFGATGMCTMGCSGRSCPPGADCAMLGDGRELCLRACTADFRCADDPLLTCVGAGNGDLGYQLVSTEPISPVSHCAPKECSSDNDCLPAGKCDADHDGHCIAR